MSTTWTAFAAAVTGPRKASKEGKLLWNLWVMCARTAKSVSYTHLREDEKMAEFYQKSQTLSKVTQEQIFVFGVFLSLIHI